MAAILRRIASVKEWYTDLSIGERCFLTFAFGNVCGTFYGTYVRRSKIGNEISDHLVITTYHVDEKKRKTFEATWSDMAPLP
mmetsp:Transcript_34602/g.77644  ORF Transcript_34602/g.77644 Transcript_34602/m.77644 type:complete len:82 (-) Transcript_34602:11-256(-)